MRGNVNAEEEKRSQKLKLIGNNTSVEDMDAEDAVHRMALALEEKCIDS